MKDFTQESLERQSVAAKSLIDGLQSDDETLNINMIEGETDFFEAVEKALEEIQECEILQAGVAEMTARLSERANRAKKRAEKLRGLIDQAFQMAEIKSHVFSCATITTKKVPAKLIITDEASIPARFFVPQPPKLDKKALTDAAKAEPVPGAEMSNGGTTIQIRRA